MLTGVHRFFANSAIVGVVSLASFSAAQAQVRAFDIPAAPAAKAIPDFARQSGLQIVAPVSQLRGVVTPAVSGNLDSREALRRLLVNTGLEVASDNGSVIVLRVGSRASFARIAEPAYVAQPAEGGAPAAQATTVSALEEVVVTARKVGENLMEVPLAITAVTASDINARNIKDLNDISAITPSFSFSNQQGATGRNDRSTASLTFRGLFLGNNTGLTAGGQMFIDGAPIVGGQPPSTSDVERVEILKGPQSAYFGRSTFVGAINFIMREPADDFGGRISAEYSSFDSSDVSASVEGPVVRDRLNVRLGARLFHEGGQYDNAAGGKKLGERRTASISASAVFTPIEALKVKAFVNVYENADGPPAQAAMKGEYRVGIPDRAGNCRPLTPLPPGIAPGSSASRGYFCGTIPSVGEFPARFISGDYALDLPGRNALLNPPAIWPIFSPGFIKDYAHRRQAVQADLRIDYTHSSGWTLSALSAIHWDKSSNLIDLNYRDAHDQRNPLYVSATVTPHLYPYRKILVMNQARLEDWSQEVRLTSPQAWRLRGLIGFNYLHAYSPGAPVFGHFITGSTLNGGVNKQWVRTPSVFGAAYYDFTPQLTLSLEGRYQWDQISQKPIIGTTGLPVTGPAARKLEETFESFSPRITLDYKYAGNSTVYVLFSRGYRPGGFNAALVTASGELLAGLRQIVPDAQLAYDQERVDNYEAGLKATWWGGRARATVAAYRMDWIKGQSQNSVAINTSSGASLISLTVNNGKAALKGVEVEAQLKATDALTLTGSFGWNDSRIGSFNCSECNNVYGSFDAVGNKLPTVPDYTWALSAEYRDRLTDAYDWFGRVDYTHTGQKQVDFSNVAQTAEIDLVNVRLGVASDRLSIEAFVNNLFDNDEMAHALQGSDVFQIVAGPALNARDIRVSLPKPRWFGVRAAYTF